MLLSIFLAIVICGAVVAALFLVAPLTLSLSVSFKESSRQFTSYLSWFHPALLRCDFDGKKRSFSIMVFGRRFRRFSPEDDETLREGGTYGKGGTDRLRPEKHKTVEKRSSPDEQEKPREHLFKDPGPKDGESATADTRTESTRTEGPSPKESRDDPGKAFQKEKKKMFGFMGSLPAKRALIIFRAASLRRKIFRWLMASISRFSHIVSVSRFRLSVRLGLGDPSQTGQAYGYFIAAKGALAEGTNSHKEILFEPVFNEEVVEAEGAIEISSSLARLCLPFVLAVATFPFLHSAMVYLKVKRIKAGT